MAEIKVDINDYIELYRNGLTLDQIKPLKNQTYKIFKSSKVDIRIVHRRKTYEDAQAFQKIKKFTEENEYFYMIPVTTIKETIVGFILRGVLQSNYATVSRKFDDLEKRVPLMFGFDRSFQNFENHKTCPPIVVCEGSKDCLFMKHLYPYVVAVNTSSMGLNAPILINMTNKFILAYDNDKAGQEGMERDKSILRSAGAQVVSLELSQAKDENGKFLIKDCSDYIKYPDKIRELREELKYKYKRLLSF